MWQEYSSSPLLSAQYMQATIVKTIHFNCPACRQPVEAPAEASGKLISCPSCGREFNSPRPAPKASLYWLIVLCLGFIGVGMLTGVPIEHWLARRKAMRPENPAHQRARFRAEAQSALLQQCTNSIVGLHQVIAQDTRFLDENPGKWTADVTAEFVNPVGGIERTELPFAFWIYHSPLDGLDHVLCRVDEAKISQAQHDALLRRFGLTDTSPAITVAK